MRGLQSLLAGLPGGALHHHGKDRDGRPAANLGTEDQRMNTLIRNGRVVTARETIAADVLIEGEVIKEVRAGIAGNARSEEHTSELQSLRHLVCRLLLE